ncbi:MAG TPA: 2Fe-2S iron-sulfur cluster-binding protein [Steroidobacteraceae bacterium]|nr:2Fe-2S iron-sulfur cluster-binding protein [Steroidobacteraceae bacterium]
MHRLDPRPHEWIDRSAVIRFSFEGQGYQGYRGDTISSALAAAVPYVGRSFKYHRPRGILSCANHDSNAIFQVDGVPNVRGDVTLLREGMQVSAVNTFGGLRHDRARVLDRFARFLPVGFYYKAFHSKRFFPRWERMFRSITGLGVVGLEAQRQVTPKRYGFCDVLVVGGGPSGLSAALAAAEAGAQVALVDEAFRLGGASALGGAEAQALDQLIDAVSQSRRITVLPATVAAGCYADRWLALAEPDRMTKMRARAVVFATGVIEQPAVFRNNDLPGVLLASAAWRLLERYAVAPGRSVVMVGANLEAYSICLELCAAGVRIAAIVDLRASAESDAEAQACAALGIEVLRACAPYEAVAGTDGAVRALVVAPLDASGRVQPSRRRRIDCDAVLMSVGWASAAHLFVQAGGTTRFSEELQQFVPKEEPSGILAAGRMNGVYELAQRIADGRRAGSQAAAHAGFGAPSSTIIARSTRRPSHPFPIIDHPKGKNFVDFDEDLQVKDLENAAQEGFDSSELLKRYSTVGMGPSQGKHSNMNALRILARARGVGVEELGLTTLRPMYHPVPMKLLAGRGFNIERHTPIDARHRALGAVWMPAGNWRRPEFYAVAGESRAQSIEKEVEAVRSSVGLIDVGTLGKIEIYGQEAGAFLDRVYAGKYSDMKVGTTRYGLMLDESGVIVDDGVIARLAAQMFYFTTTTSGSATVFRELQRWNALWGLECGLVNVTGHRAAFNFAGPLSRELLAPLTDIDLSEPAFPFLGARAGRVADVEARLMRVGFVGELGYEIHVPASGASRVWQALHEAGLPRGLRPFGVEAQRVLRLEKGHLIVSQDTDGLTDPFEANAQWAVSMGKPFFVGQRSLKILKARGPRQKLVGVEMLEPTWEPRESQLIIDQGAIAGRLTSVVRSRTLGKTIGLAMLKPALAQVGTEIKIRAQGGGVLAARVVATPFYDPQNLRQRAGAGA